MRRSPAPAPQRLGLAALACAALVTGSLASCGLAHDDEGLSDRHLSAGTANPSAEPPDPVVTNRPAASNAGAGSDDRGSAGPSTPGDVTATPTGEPPATATASPDAGATIVCEEPPALAAADPITLQEAMLGIADPDRDLLLSVGEAVAIDGDTLAIAALRNAQQTPHGSVLVFVRSGESWVQQAELLPPTGEPDSWFGQALALSGDTLAVGAPEEWFDYPAGHGKVHVFTRSLGTWRLETTLTAETPMERDYFGRSIALSGDTLAVAEGTIDEHGRIEVFERGAAGFEHTQTLLPEPVPETEADTFWVGPLALDGDILAVSTLPAIDDSGQRVQVYERSDGLWQPTALVAGDRPGEAFGLTLALQGHTMVVGDPYLGGNESGGTAPEGGAYVFARECDRSWTQRALLIDDSEPQGGDFGHDVAIDGNRIFVGEASDPLSARGIDGEEGTRDDDDAYTGSVRVYGPVDGGYEQLTFLKPDVQAPRETYFGGSLAASGGRLVVGARGQDAAYVFH
jgi:hypothetical protein